MKKILFVSSSGGHYSQLRAYLGTSRLDFYSILVAPSSNGVLCNKYIYIKDVNARNVFGIFRLFGLFLVIFLKNKPDLVVSTGAAPGGISILVSKLFFVKSIWIDSIANASEPSLSGKLVKGMADTWITQSPDVQKKVGGKYIGKIFNIY